MVNFMSQTLPSLVLEPDRPADAAVIWLHGLGANGHDFEPIVPQLGLQECAVRFVFPHAPELAVTLNNGLRMPAWYDIVSLDFDQRADLAGVRRSVAQVNALIEAEKRKGLGSERIVLAGFSQGGAIALYGGLRHADPLAGILALSTYLIDGDSLAGEASEANRATEVMLMHGDFDSVVPFPLAQTCHQILSRHGQPMQWHHYPMDHQVCATQIEEIGHWLRQRLYG